MNGRQLLRRKVVVTTARQFKLDITGAKREKKKPDDEKEYLWSEATKTRKEVSTFGAERLERNDTTHQL
jgi:hypothetical protein